MIRLPLGRFGRQGETHNVFQSCGTTEGVIFEVVQEVLSILGLFLELIRVVDLLDVLLESL